MAIRIKRIAIIVFSLLICVFVCSACSVESVEQKQSTEEQNIQIEPISNGGNFEKK